MRRFLLLILFTVTTAFAEVGQVTRVLGAEAGHVLRDGKSIPLAPSLALELNDVVATEGALVVIHLYPTTQLSLAKNTQIKISEHQIREESATLERSFSVIDYMKGILRVQVAKDAGQEVDQQVRADGVAFGVRGTEFEVSTDGDDVDLDVVEGQVEVSSPFVQSFVPEYVKANEGLRFNRKKKGFERRKLRLRFKDHPGFRNKGELLREWKARRQALREKRTTLKDERSEKRHAVREKRGLRRERLRDRKER
jgi:hypothetical protein